MILDTASLPLRAVELSPKNIAKTCRSNRSFFLLFSVIIIITVMISPL